MAKRAVKTRKLPAVRHVEGCPEDPQRMEAFRAHRPDGTDVEVTRCVDCAAQVVTTVGSSSSSTEGDA